LREDVEEGCFAGAGGADKCYDWDGLVGFWKEVGEERGRRYQSYYQV